MEIHTFRAPFLLIFLGTGMFFPVARGTTTFTTINYPGSQSTAASGINDSGVIVGEYMDGGGNTHGFVDNNGVYTEINVPGSTFTQATGINAAGEIVGDYNGGAFSYTGGVFTLFNDPNGTSGAFGINSTGKIVGFFTNSSSVTEGFLDNGGTFTTIFDVNSSGTNGTAADGINDAGTIVGTYDVINTGNGFVYNGSTYTTTNVPGATGGTYLHGINNSGQMAGYYSTGGANQGFLDIGGAITTIDVPGATSTGVLGLNNEGQLVGFYINGSGQQFGFLADTAPEPASYGSWV
jgi:hypothetical protein